MCTNKPFNYHIYYVFSLFDAPWLKMGALLQAFKHHFSTAQPSNSDAQRKAVLWLEFAIGMCDCYQNVLFLCLLLVLKPESRIVL